MRLIHEFSAKNSHGVKYELKRILLLICAYLGVFKGAFCQYFEKPNAIGLHNLINIYIFDYGKNIGF